MTHLASDAPSSASSGRRWRMIAGIVAGIILLIVAAIYLTQPASSLPAFFPGHAAVPTTLVHYKHGLAAALLGIAALVFAWFNSGPTSAKQE